MNDERISALMDGESAEDEFSETIDSLLSDTELRQAWSRYHLIGDVLRADGLQSETPAASPVEIRPDKVVDLADRRHAYGPLAGFAIAASVAALAVTLALRSGQPPTEPGFQVAATVTAQPLAPAPIESIQSQGAPAVVAIGEYDQRLNGYLVNFNEQRARLGVPGVHPYVRIVGFEAE